MENTVLTLPVSAVAALSIRAKALVFHDPASLELLQQVERLAPSEATVLITGETGTGKELIARHIHLHSGRRGPFVAVNCGALSENLIDAELFGHESGAFTGALHARAGWFEAAQGGTLFLDEIGDLPLSLQVKLLRVLQERQVVRLGARRGIALDVRLVAATHIDLASAVEAQHFRADLFYRLSVAAVRLAPLRQRRGDILPLVRHFIQLYCARQQRPAARLSAAAAQALMNYGWPGNIRELENVVHFALIVARGDLIEAEDLRLVPLSTPPEHEAGEAQGHLRPGAFESEFSDIAQGLSAAEDPVDSGLAEAKLRLLTAWQDLLALGRPALLDEVEGWLVHAAFAHGQHKQVRAAAHLGITRNTMRTLLKRHGMLMDCEAAEATQAPQPASVAGT